MKKITGNDIAELFDRVKVLEKKLGVTHIPKGLKIGDEFKLADIMIIPELSEPPVRTLGATIPENESHIFR